jgi:hypothetical protein
MKDILCHLLVWLLRAMGVVLNAFGYEKRFAQLDGPLPYFFQQVVLASEYGKVRFSQIDLLIGKATNHGGAQNQKTGRVSFIRTL